MSKTRAEILTDLQQRLGRSEQTEHFIDWVLDLWETKDFLLKCFGRAYTTMVLHPVESCSADFRRDDLVVDEGLQEEMLRALLN